MLLRRSFFLLGFVLGCGHTPPHVQSTGSELESTPRLIAESDREHDLGAVIAAPGRRVCHRYHLVNTTPGDVKILAVINRKTCCGIVEVGSLSLRSGESTDVAVTLLVGGRFGSVVHQADVVTDLRSDSEIALRTTALAVPVVRFEDSSGSVRTVLMGASGPRRAEFRILASGTAAENPLDLGRLGLRSTIKVDWTGPKEQSSALDGLSVESRPFAAWLDSAGPPGDRRAEILLTDGKETIGRHELGWEVVSPIAVSPKTIVIRPEQRHYRVLMESRDDRSFRITKVECSMPGLECRAASAGASVVQGILVGGVPRPMGGRGVLVVFTDHPAQGKVEVPLLVLD